MSQLDQYISQGEHQQQDFKHSIGSSKKLAITIAAFANTKGGRLLIGVKDNGKISGIRPEEELHMIEGAAQVFCKPEVTFGYQLHRSETKTVLEISIPESTEKPHLAKTESGKWLAFIRVEDENFPTDAVILQYWKDGNIKSKQGIKYTQEDKTIIQLIKDKPGSLYKEIAENSDLPRFQVINKMAHLLRWDILTFEIDEKGIYYYLMPEE